MNKFLSLIAITTILVTTGSKLTNNNVVFYTDKNVDDIECLSNVLIDRNLGEIYVGTSIKPTAKQIKIALVKNRNFDLDANAVSVADISSTDAKIVGDGIKYIDKIIVFFKITNFKNIINQNILSSSKHKEAIWRSTTDNKGWIYFITNFANIYRSNGKDSVTKIGHIDNLVIHALTVDKDGNIYVGGRCFGKNENRVYWSDGKELFKPIKLSLIGEDVWELLTDQNGGVFVATSKGKIFKSHNKIQFTLIRQLEGGVFNLMINQKGNIFALTNQNKIYLSNDKEIFTLFQDFNNKIFNLTLDDEGNVYLAARHPGVYQTIIYQSNGKEPFKVIDTLKCQEKIKKLAVDKNKNLYALTIEDSIYQSKNQKPFIKMKGISGDYLYFSLDYQGNIFVVTYNGDIYRSDVDIIDKYPIHTININYQYTGLVEVYWNSSFSFDKEKNFSIIKYDEYAYNWNDFVKNNNYSILYIKGLEAWAKSHETFGETSKLYSNLIPFKDEFSINLLNIHENTDEKNPYQIILYDVYDAVFASYSTKVKCYLEFFIYKEKKELKVKLKTRNYLWSAGAYNRKLQVYFKLDTVTFFPY